MASHAENIMRLQKKIAKIGQQRKDYQDKLNRSVAQAKAIQKELDKERRRQHFQRLIEGGLEIERIMKKEDPNFKLDAGSAIYALDPWTMEVGKMVLDSFGVDLDDVGNGFFQDFFMKYIAPAYYSNGEPLSKSPGIKYTINRKWLWQKYLEVVEDPNQRFQVIQNQ